MGAAAAVGAVGLGLSLIGQKNAADAQQEAYARQEDAYRRQEIIAQRNAKLAKEQAKYNADLQQVQAEKEVASTRAGYAASGVTSSSGSVFNVIQESVFNAELDKQNIINGGDIRSRSYVNQAVAASSAAAGASSAASSVGRASTYQMLGTAFMGGASLYGKYGK